MPSTRARKRSDRFVDAAVELLSERDESDFSIQDVVDRSGQSQRTFYTFFDSKDSLMLAVYETILRKTAMPMLRQRCEGIEDPVLRLRALLEALSEITAMPARLARGLSVLHLRLAETRPKDLAYALEPLARLHRRTADRSRRRRAGCARTSGCTPRRRCFRSCCWPRRTPGCSQAAARPASTICGRSARPQCCVARTDLRHSCRR